MLRARNLGKRYGSRWVIRGLDLDLRPGDCLCVTGRNGAGKSTLLKLIAGLISPTEGEMPDRPSIGYTALDLSVYPSLTALEHMEFFAALQGATVAPGALGQVGLAQAGDRLGGELSTGMRSRLKLALAIQPKPQVLLLDEPGAGLDQEGRVVMESIIKDQVSRGVVIFATNDPAERRLGNLALNLDA